jgi:nitroreductase
MIQFPKSPRANERLVASNPDPEFLEFLGRRRSTPLPLLQGPGPDEAELQQILRLASRVPDHRRMVPWRFVVFAGAQKQVAAELIGARFATLNPDCTDEEKSAEQRKFTCSPVVIALVSCPQRNHKTPVWEQELVAGAVGQNLLLASNAAGFAGVWLTYWYAFDPEICTAFGLIEHERIAGFFHLGAARENPKERLRPVMEDIVSYWSP